MPAHPKSPYLVPTDGRFKIRDAPHGPPKDAPDGKSCRKKLERVIERIAELQRTFAAHDRHALLLVFQAMDAAGKDGTIRAVTSGVDPSGFQVSSFKAPSNEELDHDFLWRCAKRLPERGRIGIFNRSWYEEVLIARVHPGILDAQRLPPEKVGPDIWEDRCESIADFERHLARNGTIVLKFFLNVSRDEQARRFIARVDDPEKNWKFSAGDVRQREHWDAYQEAFEYALRRTSTKHAPWYAIPADDKPFMRLTVARIILEQLESLRLEFPAPDAADREEMLTLREQLAREIGEA
ncbi:MAG: polyphosphate kinase 2 family protein [Planctomycetota bacterium]